MQFVSSYLVGWKYKIIKSMYTLELGNLKCSCFVLWTVCKHNAIFIWFFYLEFIKKKAFYHFTHLIYNIQFIHFSYGSWSGNMENSEFYISNFWV